jgi:hypothetical protein
LVLPGFQWVKNAANLPRRRLGGVRGAIPEAMPALVFPGFSAVKPSEGGSASHSFGGEGAAHYSTQGRLSRVAFSPSEGLEKSTENREISVVFRWV